MPTQQQIAEHLDISQQQISELMQKLNINWQADTLDQIRVAYIRNLRSVAAGHRSSDGMDLTRERVLTERVDRELKELMVSEKRGMLVNVEQLEPELMNMISAFRGELLARDDKLKTDLDALYAINLDLNLLNEHTYAALAQLARYESSSGGADHSVGAGINAIGTNEHGAVGPALPGAVLEGIGATGTI
jgi:hypothetical protein